MSLENTIPTGVATYLDFQICPLIPSNQFVLMIQGIFQNTLWRLLLTPKVSTSCFLQAHPKSSAFKQGPGCIAHGGGIPPTPIPKLLVSILQPGRLSTFFSDVHPVSTLSLNCSYVMLPVLHAGCVGLLAVHIWLS